MYPVLFRIGSFEITSFGVLVAAGALIGIWIFQRELARRSLPEAGVDAGIAGVLGGLVGAKLLWTLEHVGEEPLAGLLFSRGGMSWFGGLLGGVGAGIWMLRRRGIPVMAGVAAASPGLALGHAVGRIGCFLVGDDYGRPTDLPWGVAFPEGLPPTDVPVHPTQLYEMALLLPVTWLLIRWRRHAVPDRVVLGRYLVLAGIIRFAIEFIRVNEPVAGPLTLAHLIAGAITIAGVSLLVTKGVGMKRSSVAVVAATVALSPSLSAQWPLYPYAGAPRTPDGKLNLAAPAPRAADGKPDLSGVWMARATGDPNSEAGRPPRANFGNAGVGFKDDLPFQPWARDLQRKRSAEFSKENPDGLCLPESTLQLHLDPQPFRIVQTPGAIYIIYETNYGLRTIYTDGRPLPPQGVPQPYWHGYSVGRWEGETLLVETNNYRDGGWLDARGSPITDAARVSERIRRVNYGQIDIELTVNDPKAYTQPFTVRIDERLLPDGSDLIEFICNENQQFGKRVKIQ